MYNQKEIWYRLEKIFQRKQKGEFVSKKEMKFFDTWAVSTYKDAPVGKVRLEIPMQGEPNPTTLNFSTPAAPDQLRLSRMRHKKYGTEGNLCIKPSILKKIPEPTAVVAISSMSSVFVVLPDGLTEHQMVQLSQLEFSLSYAATYIVRKTWGEKFCPLPSVTHYIQKVLNAWSEPWFRISKLCRECHDFLPDSKLKKMPRSWDWLFGIVQEHRLSKCNSLLEDGEKSETIVTKTEQASYFREIANVLEARKNPYSPIETPSLHLLMSTGISLLNRTCPLNDDTSPFKTDYWNPYISSLRAWAAVLERNPHIKAVAERNGRTVRELRGCS